LEIWSFLGLAGYYQWFIKNFSKIARPMMKLLEKNKAFEWTVECQASFEELKNILLQHQCWFYRTWPRSLIYIVMLYDEDWDVYWCKKGK
jgi:hypothetical protein